MAEQPRPNILFITSDQHRGDCFGFEGRKVKTPHLDQMAADGTRFSACITPNPLCQPARASILTGLLPRTHGVVDNGYDLSEEVGEAGFGGQIARAGYNTAFIGKAHFSTYNTYQKTGRPECVRSFSDYSTDWMGPYMGFPHVELMVLGHNVGKEARAPKGQHYERWLRAEGRDESLLELYNTRLEPDVGARNTWTSALPPLFHHSSWVGDRTINFLRAQKDQPFCAWASFVDPHPPYDCPHPWARMHHPDEIDLPYHFTRDLERRPWWHKAYFETAAPDVKGPLRVYSDTPQQLRQTIANYYSMISLVDHNVGRILMALEELELADNTLVVFSSDHGDWLGDHGFLSKGPLLYEGLMRVGMIARGLGVAKGQVVDQPVATTDIQATLMDFAGAPPAKETHSRSLRPLLENPAATRDFAYGEWDPDPVGWGLDLKLRFIRTREHKLILEENTGVGELYNLRDDPHEMDNVFDSQSHAGVRKEMIDMIRSRPEDMMDPLQPPTGLY